MISLTIKQTYIVSKIRGKYYDKFEMKILLITKWYDEYCISCYKIVINII